MSKKTILITILSIALLGLLGFYYSNQNKSVSYIGADGNSANGGYRSDVNGVYFQGNIIKGLDPKTSKYIDSGCVRDSKSLNCFGSFISNVNISTFRSITPEYYKDATSVYKWYGTGVEKLPNADPKTFEVLGGGYSKDVNSIYFNTKIVNGASPKTAVYHQSDLLAIVGGYLKDTTGLYFLGEKIKNLDSATFIYIGEQYSKDKNGVYHSGRFGDDTLEPVLPVLGADPITFEIVNPQYAKDKNHIFEFGKQTTADPKKCTNQTPQGCQAMK